MYSDIMQISILKPFTVLHCNADNSQGGLEVRIYHLTAVFNDSHIRESTGLENRSRANMAVEN